MNISYHGHSDSWTNRSEYVERENLEQGEVVALDGREVKDSNRLGEVLSVERRDLGEGSRPDTVAWESVVRIRDLESGEIIERKYQGERVHLADAETTHREVSLVASRSKTKQHVGHVSVNWQPGEEVTTEEAIAVAHRLLEEWGLDKNQAEIAVHRDTHYLTEDGEFVERPHVHIVFNRVAEVSPGQFIVVDPNKQYVYDEQKGRMVEHPHPRGRQRERGDYLMRTLELEHNREHPDRRWEHSPGGHYRVNDDGLIAKDRDHDKRARGKTAAYERLAGENKISFRSWVRQGSERGVPADDLRAALKNPLTRSWDGLHAAADRWNLRIEPRNGGFVFVDRDNSQRWHCEASWIGSEFAKPNLEATLGEYEPPKELRRSFATSGYANFAQYVTQTTIIEELKDAIKTGSADRVEDIARKYGLGFAKKGGGYVVIDRTAQSDAQRQVKLTDLGNAFRRVDSKLDRGLRPPAQDDVANEIAGEMKRYGYADFLDDEILRLGYEKGEQIARDPYALLLEISETNSTFTANDVEQALARNCVTEEQKKRAWAKIDQLCAQGKVVQYRIADPGVDGRGKPMPQERFALPETLVQEGKLFEALRAMKERPRRDAIAITPEIEAKLATLDPGQREFVERLLHGESCVIGEGFAGAGKSYAYQIAREIMEPYGYNFLGVTPTGKQADGLQKAGMKTMTIDALAARIRKGESPVNEWTVLAFDEAGMAGTKHGLTVFGEALAKGAAIQMTGDERQLPGVQAGDFFRVVKREFGEDHVAQMSKVWRQKDDDLLRACNFARDSKTVGESVDVLASKGWMHEKDTNLEAWDQVVELWDRGGKKYDDRLMIAFSNQAVDAINERTITMLRNRGELGEAVHVDTKKGERTFYVGQELYFLRNEYEQWDVRNGARGTLVALTEEGHLQIRKHDGAVITVDPQEYNHLDHGYCATAYRAQSLTCQAVYVFAERADYRNSWYVEISRAEHEAHAVISKEEFFFEKRPHQTIRENFKWLLEAERSQHMASGLHAFRTDERDAMSEFVTRTYDVEERRQSPDLGKADGAPTVRTREQAEIERRVETEAIRKEREIVRRWFASADARKAYPDIAQRRAERERLYSQIDAKYADERERRSRERDQDAILKAQDLGKERRMAAAAQLGLNLERYGDRRIFRFEDGSKAFSWDGRRISDVQNAAAFDAAMLYTQARCGGVTLAGNERSLEYGVRRAVELNIDVRNPELQNRLYELRAHRQAAESVEATRSTKRTVERIVDGHEKREQEREQRTQQAQREQLQRDQRAHEQDERDVGLGY